MITSYAHGGRLSALSTRVINPPTATVPESESKCIVGFHLKMKPSADEAAMRGAGCKIETVDESGSPVALQADLHFFYPVSPPCQAIYHFADKAPTVVQDFGPTIDLCMAARPHL